VTETVFHHVVFVTGDTTFSTAPKAMIMNSIISAKRIKINQNAPNRAFY
jgi:hypothetical protein